MNIALDALVHTWSGWAFASVVLVVGWSLAALFAYVALRLVMAYNARRYDVRRQWQKEYQAALHRISRGVPVDEEFERYRQMRR